MEADEDWPHCRLGFVDAKESGVETDWVEGGFDTVCCGGGGGCEKSSKAAKRSADMFEDRNDRLVYPVCLWRKRG